MALPSQLAMASEGTSVVYVLWTANSRQWASATRLGSRSRGVAMGVHDVLLTGEAHRFAAAVAGGAISDIVSLAGTCDVGPRLAQQVLAGLPHEDMQRLWRSSPHAHVAQVETLALVLHGQLDDRCPAGQAELMFSALQQASACSTRARPGLLTPVAPEGRPPHLVDYSRRLFGWVTQYTSREQV